MCCHNATKMLFAKYRPFSSGHHALTFMCKRSHSESVAWMLWSPCMSVSIMFGDMWPRSMFSCTGPDMLMVVPHRAARKLAGRHGCLNGCWCCSSRGCCDEIIFLSGKLWYLQHHCVGDTIVYHLDTHMAFSLFLFSLYLDTDQWWYEIFNSCCITSMV